MLNGLGFRALTNRRTDRQTGPILLPRLLTREVNIALTDCKFGTYYVTKVMIIPHNCYNSVLIVVYHLRVESESEHF